MRSKMIEEEIVLEKVNKPFHSGFNSSKSAIT